MSSSDCLPDHPLSSDLVRRLKSALDARDEETVSAVICTQVRHVDAVIELANDDWMKDPAVQLPPQVLLARSRELGTQWTLVKFPAVPIDTDAVFTAADRDKEINFSLDLTGVGVGEVSGPWSTRVSSPRPCASRQPEAMRPAWATCPGGRGPLHEACLGGHTACARLLLQHRAHPDLLSAEGLAPLHLCRTAASLGCAQALLEHGASVHRVGGASLDTPLHVAAQRGLDEHARLYLGRGARVDARNGRGETALSTACGAEARGPEEQERGLRVCALLLRRGAAADARDEDERSPLHKACGHARPGLALLLLQHGADAAALDYGGASPLARVLQAASLAPQAKPQRTVQALLNHGAPTLWPDAFPKVLQACAPAPAVIEVLFNAYAQLRVSESWREAIPEEVFQAHRPFYQSLFALAGSPRSLLHLCRCAIRRRFGKQCFRLVPLLPLPVTLQSYLLLEPEGVLR
uniref:Ankyrin repeat and SOCS box containing 18 n=1 Tax=Pipistrellus kuhlii TaxID=59472 RepID=A0A7J7XTE9_PIPKU|nr:ankyrin repeat and SOCS box containing 18 [Pipistrellus kuhlii]